MRYKILISGLVQGIGFRPFVAELAEELKLTGQVKNLGGIVEIIVSGEKQAVDDFIQRLRCVEENGDLPGCRIDNMKVDLLENEVFAGGENIKIVGNETLLFTPMLCTTLQSIERTSRMSQSDTHLAIGDWNMGVARYVHWIPVNSNDETSVGNEEGVISPYTCNEEQDFKAGFRIVESGMTRETRRFLPVDLPTCDRCIAEMHDPSNRRFRYPFISCTACGPRFSIQKAVPYDRETITMDDFPMCEACRKEYTRKGNIRRHAQTIACTDCGPKLRYVAPKDINGRTEGNGCGRMWTDGGNEVRLNKSKDPEVELGMDFTEITEEQAVEQAVFDLKNGKIGAIKDIGGYHFAFSPFSGKAAERLRVLKHRDKKPFAVMFLNMEGIREYCVVSKKEEELLLSSARPIVLLKKKKDFVPEICGASDRIGALLPCNPLQVLLLEETGPLVMTSGNRGGEPIIISEDEMKWYIGNGIDFMLTHDREILTPLDDSIYQVAEITIDSEKSIYGVGSESFVAEGADDTDKRNYVVKSVYIPQLIRRARGLVPEPIALKRKLKKDTFAAGGDLKAVFALGREALVYLSQYFGDLEDVRCMESRQLGRARMEQLLEIHPEITVGDLHPAYISTQDTEVKIQHHHAHAASVIAEHGLEGKVLGIVCDGTGFGTDGTIWGSEFLLCEDGNMRRKGHFSSVKLVGGDASAKQADMTLFSYMLNGKECGLDVSSFLEECYQKDREAGRQNFALQEMAWKQNINTAYSSSMGRLFDTAAAVLDICHYNSYEGECAIMLEQMAHRGKAIIEPEQMAYRGKTVIEPDKMAHRDKQINELERLIYEDTQNIKLEKTTYKDMRKIEWESLSKKLKVDCVKIDGIWQADAVKLLVDLYYLKQNDSKEILAYLFHHAVAEAIVETAMHICEENEVSQIALSGGTFINRILLGEVMNGLCLNGKDVYINEKVPCGDGGIALGQMYLATFEE